jgi:hypothetical protein
MAIDRRVLADGDLTGDETYRSGLPSPLRTRWWH